MSHVRLSKHLINGQPTSYPTHALPPTSRGLKEPCHATQDFSTFPNYPVVCSIWHYQNSKLNFPGNFNDLLELPEHRVHRKLSGTKRTKPLMALTPGVEIGGLKGIFPILVYTRWYWLKICQQVCLSFVI